MASDCYSPYLRTECKWGSTIKWKSKSSKLKLEWFLNGCGGSLISALIHGKDRDRDWDRRVVTALIRLVKPKSPKKELQVHIPGMEMETEDQCLHTNRTAAAAVAVAVDTCMYEV